ncbi:hypothetical protein ACQJBY_061242 [Aegilops geniculata]
MGAEQQQQAAGGSRFAAAFGLLRQYMREQPGAGDAAVAPEQRIRTMELFPQQAGTVRGSHDRTGPERAPLTIFFGGRTFVFDDFPAEKARELMQLAGSFCAPPPASDAGAGAEPACQSAPGQSCLSDLPIARKASLHRFLEKRKSRLAAADPYPAPLAAAPGAGAAKETAGKAAPEDGGAPWLGVNSALQLN